jgi:replicative DNA helicase
MTDQTIAIEPNNREAEEALLGAVLINPESYHDVAGFLKPGDFYIHRNGWIWEAYSALVSRKIPIDSLTVAEELERSGRLEESGGAAFLVGLMSSVPTSLHAEAYGRIVEEQSVRRQLLNVASVIAAGANDCRMSLQDVQGIAEQALLGVTRRQVSGEPVLIQSAASEFYDRMEYLSDHPEEATGIDTGFYDLDRLISLRKSNFIVIAARPSMGKTSLLIDLALHAAEKRKKWVGLFSLEMSKEEILERMITRSGLKYRVMEESRLDKDQWVLFVKAVEGISQLSIVIDETPAVRPLELHSKCRLIQLQYGLDIVLVDYLQLMEPDVKSRQVENRTQEVTYISRQLKALAKEMRVPVVAAAQLSRAVEQRTSKRPVLSDLRESGSIEADADIVMFLHRPESADGSAPVAPNGWILTNLIVDKHRNGPTGDVPLMFEQNCTRFHNAERGAVKDSRSSAKESKTSRKRALEISPRWQEEDT